MWRLIIVLLCAGALVGLVVYSYNMRTKPVDTADTSAAAWEDINSPKYQDLSENLKGKEAEPTLILTSTNSNSDMSTENVSSSQPVQTSATKIVDKTQTSPPTAPIINPKKQYSAVLNTSVGNITITLDAAGVPNTVNNFVYLAKLKFYDDTIFHRVIKDFMIQGGDPIGNGTGGPAYRFADEPFTDEYERGTLAMANAGPDTNGSQFFIMHAAQALPKNYVIFGKVTQGMDTVDKIATAEVTMSNSGELSQLVTPVVVKTVDVVEK